MWRLRNLECWLCGSQLIALQRHLNLLVFVTCVPALLLDTCNRTKWSCLVQTELTTSTNGALGAFVSGSFGLAWAGKDPKSHLVKVIKIWMFRLCLERNRNAWNF